MDGPRRITLDDGAYLDLYERFLTEEAGALFRALHHELPFAQRTIRIYGKEVLQPRLVAWVGEPEALYRYSGTVHEPAPFGPVLRALCSRVSACVQAPFNSVLCNLYRDGQDAMGMHADNEPELGDEPVIASLSLGAPRRFVLRHRQAGHTQADLTLTDGSLLVMRGTTQRFYKHGLPRQRSVHLPRMNLTFRHTDAARARSASARR